jgi:hypothetical protein
MMRRRSILNPLSVERCRLDLAVAPRAEDYAAIARPIRSERLARIINGAFANRLPAEAEEPLTMQ